MNPHRGEATLTGQSGTWRIQFTHNALAALEDALDMPLMRLGDALENDQVGIRELRLMTWAGLEGWRRKHANGNPPYDVDQAGDVMDDVGFETVMDTVTQALVGAFGDVVEEATSQADGGGEATPPQAEDGTGDGS